MLQDMTQDEITQLEKDCSMLLEIFKKHDPVAQGGAFDSEKVKLATTEMLSAILDSPQENQALLDWMEKNEFWTSPASTRFHGNTKGGLAAHSLMVIYQALFFAPSVARNFIATKRCDIYSFNAKEILIAALAHDFCKAGFYSIEYRKTKDFSGNWVHEPYYKTKPDLRNLGHGNESVLRLLEAIPSLIKNRSVIEAVSRHMGFSDLSDSESMNYSNFLQNPLVILIQLADETAAQWWGI